MPSADDRFAVEMADKALHTTTSGKGTRHSSADGINLQDECSRPPCMPATRQERLFARAYPALPLVIGTLAFFWCLSVLITLLDPSRAMSVLADRAVPGWISVATAIGGALADLALGLAILWRPWTKTAALGMLALSGGYLIGSLVVAPDLWADPLGPMVRSFPERRWPPWSGC